MTPEKENMILECGWVVNTVLNNLNMRSEDYSQIAMLYLCGLVDKYDATKNVKWTTYAYNNLTLYLKHYRKVERKKDQVYDIITNFDTAANSIPQELDIFFIDNENISKLLIKLTPMEKRLLQMRLEGYKMREMAECLGYSMGYINKQIDSIKKKARKLYEEKH